MAKSKVRISPNFENNLEAIQRFLIEQEAEPAFATVMESVFTRLIPMLESHPRMGRDWLTRSPQSGKGVALRQRIISRLRAGRELREFILDNYLVLYALEDSTVTLLAIRHHRQSSFSLLG